MCVFCSTEERCKISSSGDAVEKQKHSAVDTCSSRAQRQEARSKKESLLKHEHITDRDLADCIRALYGVKLMRIPKLIKVDPR